MRGRCHADLARAGPGDAAAACAAKNGGLATCCRTGGAMSWEVEPLGAKMAASRWRPRDVDDRCHADLARAGPGDADACAAKNGRSATCCPTGWPMSREVKPLDPKTAAPRRRQRATSTTVATPISRERAPATLPPPVPPRMEGLRRDDGPAGPRRSSGSRFFPENGGSAMAPARDVDNAGTPFVS